MINVACQIDRKPFVPTPFVNEEYTKITDQKCINLKGVLKWIKNVNMVIHVFWYSKIVSNRFTQFDQRPKL